MLKRARHLTKREQKLEDVLRSRAAPYRLFKGAEAEVLGIACRRPGELGQLEGEWRQVDIAEEAQKRGSTASRSTVQRILASAEVQPHRERYYLFTEKDRPNCKELRDAINDLVQLDLPADEVVACIDAKTGIQALGLPQGYPWGGRRAGGQG